MTKSQIRKDYFKDEYVIIAPNRAKRPHHTGNIVEADGQCHFCPQNFKNETITYQDNNYNGEWEIVAVVNKFAALTVDNPDAYGQTEVIIETRRHGLDINDFSVNHIVRIFNAYVDRFNYLRNLDGIKHVIIFKNEGGKAGASIAHTHSQAIALPILPPKTEKEGRDYNRYRLEHATCPYCDVIRKETDKERVIWEDENLFVLAPYASDAPFGVWLLPKRHMRTIADLTRAEKESIAIALKMVLGKLDEFGISYNYFVENAVNNEDYHMHIKIAPRPNIWAGLELGTGIIINPIAPEYAAKTYRGDVRIEADPKF
ncbi:MAG TPA: galactose-1-phosphate uridylyltransferase [Candidatus Saccharimonadales bacterium]|nr:galactose-1-phosphate uridylyltransferase [Candidatus Saccharimonadales bacterium]